MVPRGTVKLSELGHEARRCYSRPTRGYRVALEAAISENDVGQVASVLLARALDGDVKAGELVLSYCLGRPKMSVEVTRNPPTLDELRARVLSSLVDRPGALSRVLGLSSDDSPAARPAAVGVDDGVEPVRAHDSPMPIQSQPFFPSSQKGEPRGDGKK